MVKLSGLISIGTTFLSVRSSKYSDASSNFNFSMLPLHGVVASAAAVRRSIVDSRSSASGVKLLTRLSCLAIVCSTTAISYVGRLIPLSTDVRTKHQSAPKKSFPALASATVVRQFFVETIPDPTWHSAALTSEGCL